jgi:Mn-dependent DtxR family transcriptional regulator
MALSQIQDGILDAAGAEGKVDPGSFGRLLLYGPDEVGAAISGLADQGLVTVADDGTCSLTVQGEAVNRAKERAHRAAVVAGNPSWQRR